MYPFRLPLYGLILFLPLALTACGTTSSMQATAHAPLPNLSGFSRVIVLDFSDMTAPPGNAEKRAKHLTTMQRALKSFPDLIASEIQNTGVFNEVVRGDAHSQGQAEGLRLHGDITRLTEGSSTARLLVGFGAAAAISMRPLP